MAHDRTAAAERQRRRRQRAAVSARVYRVPLPRDVLLDMAYADIVDIESIDDADAVGEAIPAYFVRRHA